MQTYTERIPGEQKDRGCSGHASPSQRTPKTTGKPPEAKRQAWNRFPRSAAVLAEGTDPADTLISNF